MRRRLVALAIAAALTSVPAASTATYNALASFTGTHIGGAFAYGSFDGTQFTAFSDLPGCAALIAGTTCTSDGGLPAVFKTTTGAHRSGTIDVPADALVVQPGDAAARAVAVAFIAPRTGDYLFRPVAHAADTMPSTVTFDVFYPDHGGFATFLFINGASVAGALVEDKLVAGEKLGFFFVNTGFASRNAIDFNVTAASIPEPTVWVSLTIGFAMCGLAARRRREVATA